MLTNAKIEKEHIIPEIKEKQKRLKIIGLAMIILMISFFVIVKMNMGLSGNIKQGIPFSAIALLLVTIIYFFMVLLVLLVWRCPKCNTHIKSGFTQGFCSHCGTNFRQKTILEEKSGGNNYNTIEENLEKQQEYDERIIKEFGEMKVRYRLFISIELLSIILLIITVLIFPHYIWVPASIVIGVMITILTLLSAWHCPKCYKGFHQLYDLKFCPHCGVRLQ
ncbi:MAG: hypothetical protein V1871_02985 [Planctomycetota bacterium]